MALLPKNVLPLGRARELRRQRGFTLIDMLFVIALIGLLSSLALPSLGRARDRAQATSAMGTLRLINSAQLNFAITCGLGFYAPDLPTLGMAPPAALQAFLPADLTGAASVIRSGYAFAVTATPLEGAPAACNGLPPGRSSTGYAAIADPLDPATNPRFYGTNADGTLYEHTATLAGSMPESGAPALGTAVK